MRGFDQTDLPEAFGVDETLPDPLPPDPLPTFAAWFEEARQRRVQPNPNAMTVATVDGSGLPSARIVLCKKIDLERGFIVFYTNYTSRKGEALAATGRAAAVFHWDVLDRQVRLEGPVTKSPPAEGDEYFQSRRWESRLGAWVSRQSAPVESRAALLEQVRQTMIRFGIDPDRPEETGPNAVIPRPPHWGGYRLWIERAELWIGSSARIHDRAAWTRPLLAAAVDGADGFSAGPWSATRLQP